ncbi:DUF2457 domain-containing protein [Natronolimnobius sp. AArcel1]|uniref:DUF2457 domain-containing protein n=1 Tax=Natronolimnobius sp. AArcel1 TaxID=1679093 RepID=UPI0013E9DDF5|nr:DUF2457 domain-containing protein [Natronolimnobius sp. AArcel1]NGM70761.1 DUF2457 domain-containing protein [Natronolimnobius sp. AArcel1]
MNRNFGLSALLIAGVLAAAVIGVTAVAATSDANMSVHPAIDTPTETLEIEGSEYEVDEIAVVEQGDTLEVDVTASGLYNLYLYNTDVQSEQDDYTDDSQVQFDIDDLEPGSYMLSLEPDDEGRQAVTPVVVQGHDISLEYPTTVEETEDVTFEATVESAGISDQPDELEVVIWNGNAASELTLEHTGGTSYSATESMATLGTGSYEVYSAVIGDEAYEGYNLPDAVAEGDELTVTEESDDDEDSEEKNESDGDSNEDGEDESDTDEVKDDEKDNESVLNDDSDEKDDDSTDSNESDEEMNNESTDSTDDESYTDDEVGNETDDTDNGSGSDVIEPNETQETDDTAATDTADDDGLGLSTAALTAVAIATMLIVIVARDN